MALPPTALFPETAWVARMVPEEWEASLDGWILLAEAHNSLSVSEFLRITVQDNTVAAFLVSYMSQAASPAGIAFSENSKKLKKLRKLCFLLSGRLLKVDRPPENILTWEYLSDFCKVYGKTRSSGLILSLWKLQNEALGKILAPLKSFLTQGLDAGIKGQPKELEQALKHLNNLLHSSPETAIYFMNGSDFLDGLVSCYKVMNPPLRRAIISTTYLCLIGLTESPTPKISLLTDQLYSLKSAADEHSSGPTNVGDSLVAELVTVTPILRQIAQRLNGEGNNVGRANSVISSLESFRKTGDGRPKRLVKRRVNKGKGATSTNEDYEHGMSGEIHIQRMSLITQVQDLFPDLGSGFVMKLLHEYEEDAELVISHLLEDSLPPHFKRADHEEPFNPAIRDSHRHIPDIAPRSTPPLLPTRHNVFDDDEFDQLAMDISRLHFGRRNPEKTADDILKDHPSAPQKAAILSALAAFDSDDDERDDTYDIQDVGGTVDSATPGNNPEEANADTSDVNDEALFRALKITPTVFDRDAATRRGEPRTALKKETGMTDEAIEGWALVLSRDPRRMRRFEAKFSNFSDVQRELLPTAWRGDTGSSEANEISGGGKGGLGGVRGYGRGGKGRGGNVAGPSGDKDTDVARHRKEANKGSRANHNRRAQRAKKMARAGFPG